MRGWEGCRLRVGRLRGQRGARRGSGRACSCTSWLHLERSPATRLHPRRRAVLVRRCGRPSVPRAWVPRARSHPPDGAWRERRGGQPACSMRHAQPPVRRASLRPQVCGRANSLSPWKVREGEVAIARRGHASDVRHRRKRAPISGLPRRRSASGARDSGDQARRAGNRRDDPSRGVALAHLAVRVRPDTHVQSSFVAAFLRTRGERKMPSSAAVRGARRLGGCVWRARGSRCRLGGRSRSTTIGRSRGDGARGRHPPGCGRGRHPPGWGRGRHPPGRAAVILRAGGAAVILRAAGAAQPPRFALLSERPRRASHG